MLPCPPLNQRKGRGSEPEHAPSPPAAEVKGGGENAGGGHRRRLLSYERRFLAADSGGHCKMVMHALSLIIAIQFPFYN